MSLEKNKTSHTLLHRSLHLGDQNAWNELYNRYTTFVYHILHIVGVREADMDDISQEVFIELSSKFKHYDKDKGKFRGWLAGFIRFVALRHLRKKSTYQKYVDQSREDFAVCERLEKGDIETLVENEWSKYLISIAAERLTHKYRGKAATVFKLWMKGKDNTEIAEIVGIKPNTIYTFKKRIKKTLYEEAESIRADLEV